MGGGGRDDDASASAHAERRPLCARLRVPEAAGDPHRARTLEQDAVDRRAREHVASARDDLGDEVAVEALLAVVLAALEAAAVPAAVLHVAVHEVVRDAERLAAPPGEEVRPAKRRGGHLFDGELALEVVLDAPHGFGHRAATDARLALPPLEDVRRGPDADRRVDHGRPADQRALHDGPERAAPDEVRAPRVEHVAQRAEGGVRIVDRVAPGACLDDRHLRARAGERHRGRRPAGAAADDDVVGLALDRRLIATGGATGAGLEGGVTQEVLLA